MAKGFSSKVGIHVKSVTSLIYPGHKRISWDCYENVGKWRGITLEGFMWKKSLPSKPVVFFQIMLKIASKQSFKAQ